ncbi:MAG: hypothetical protein J0L63_10730 [Anaerolineae bacterium]|nr:hypothetical protein [Anaerolineae bacterium]MBN8619371.1 hypothetical protein [Anaerolineae bacterium]
MKQDVRIIVLIVFALLAGTGCSALPGLRVLTGEANPDAVADQIVSDVEFVMADKSGNTDPALMSAADRIEAAAERVQANIGNLDIIEIRKDLNSDIFEIYILTANLPNASQLDQVNAIRRINELIWQGTLEQSEGSTLIKIINLAPVPFDTLDHGPSYAGLVFWTTEISRLDILRYLNQRPNTIDDFADLVVNGQLLFAQPETQQIYSGTPNHPVFLISRLSAAQGQ